MNKHIILFVALESELPQELVPPNLPLKNGTLYVSLYYTGVGKVNAAIKATEVLSGLLPNFNTIVLNYGSSGSNTIPKGTLAKCKHFVQNDMNTPFGKIHETPFDSEIYPEIKEPTIEFGTGYVCKTQDKFEDNPQGIFDMEAYSIAKACKIYGFDFTAYKYISDSGDSNDWQENHRKGVDLFLEKLYDIKDREF